jgi:predicted lactoylglutathione lyase
MKPEIRFSSIKLAVNDIARSIAFYEGIGLEIPTDRKPEDIIVIELDNLYIELCPLSKFEVETEQMNISHNSSKIILKIIVDSNEEVDFILEKAVDYGGLMLTKPKEDDGIYTGYFKDPDGHIWKVSSYYEYNRNLEWAYD